MYLYVARDELGRVVDEKLLSELHSTPARQAEIFASSPSIYPIAQVLVWELKDCSTDELEALEELLKNRSIDVRRALLLAFTACVDMGIELGSNEAAGAIC